MKPINGRNLPRAAEPPPVRSPQLDPVLAQQALAEWNEVVARRRAPPSRFDDERIGLSMPAHERLEDRGQSMGYATVTEYRRFSRSEWLAFRTAQLAEVRDAVRTAREASRRDLFSEAELDRMFPK